MFSSSLPHPARVLGIGVDLAEISRIRRSITSRRFVERVFAREEIAAFVDSTLDPVALTGAFALKEAALKALGTGWAQGLTFAEVLGWPLEAPTRLEFRGAALVRAQQRGIQQALAQWVVCGDRVVATVLLLGVDVEV